MAKTPEKSVQFTFTCVLCLDHEPCRKYRFCDTKCKGYGVAGKIGTLLGEKTDNLEFHVDAGICRSCLLKVDRFWAFREEGKKCLAQYRSEVQSETRVKRPLSPSPEVSKESTSAATLSTTSPKLKNKKVRQAFTNPTNLPTITPPPTTSKHETLLLDDTETLLPDHRYAKTEKKQEVEKSSEPCEANVTIIKDTGIQWIPKGVAYGPEGQSFLQKIYAEVSEVCRKHTQSVLWAQRSMDSLYENKKFVQQVLQELKVRCPLLLNVLMTVCTSPYEVVAPRHIGPVIAAYAILMNCRNQELSAFQRILTAMAIKGHAQDSLITQMNAFNITQSTSSKLLRLKEAGKQNRMSLVRALQQNPLAKITGDNLYLHRQTDQQTSTKQHSHFFTSNLFLCRVAKTNHDNCKPMVNVKTIKARHMVPTPQEYLAMLDVYCVLVGRVLAERMPAFQCMNVLPKHIPHPASAQMEERTQLYTLPIILKNEAKYKEGFDILDMYEEQLTELFNEAHGNTSHLDELQVVVGGDQFTRIRLAGAKHIRSRAPGQVKRYSHIGPITIEMWHNKQDFLHKAYKALYNIESTGEPGTLCYFKKYLRRSDANGNVKTNYAAHEDLFLLLTKALIIEQAIEFFGMDNATDTPTMNSLPANLGELPHHEQQMHIKAVLLKFLQEYDYCSFSIDETPTLQQHSDKQEAVLASVETHGEVSVVPTQGIHSEDALRNYCMNLCHWGLHLLNMNDTAMEGDITRVVTNSKHMVPFFYSHSKSSPYLTENINYIIQVCHTLSPRESLRVREGSFVNTKGGKGKNIEADLKQKHSVNNRKDLIRNLGANKTKHAIKVVTEAADIIDGIVHNINHQVGVSDRSRRQTKTSTKEDIERVSQVFRQLRPFHQTPGRQCMAFNNIRSSPLDKIDKGTMQEDLEIKISQLFNGQPVPIDRDDSDDESGDEVDFA